MRASSVSTFNSACSAVATTHFFKYAAHLLAKNCSMPLALSTAPKQPCPVKGNWLAGLPQLADCLVSNPQRHFALNQSVRASVVSVDASRERFSLSLKHSVTGAADGQHAESLFASLEAAERVR